MSEYLRPRCVAVAYEKITKIGGFVQAVQRFSACLINFGNSCDLEKIASHEIKSLMRLGLSLT